MFNIQTLQLSTKIPTDKLKSRSGLAPKNCSKVACLTFTQHSKYPDDMTRSSVDKDLIFKRSEVNIPYLTMIKCA